jgi:hypothetical protein
MRETTIGWCTPFAQESPDDGQPPAHTRGCTTPVPTSTLVNLALVCHVHSRAVLALSPVMLLGALGDGSVLGRVAPEAKVEHIITNKNGRIAERNTYGHGPHEIPGQRWLLKTEMTTRAT